MSLRKAALYLFVTTLSLAPYSPAFALSDASDKMCSPFYSQCGCDQVPDPKTGKCAHQAPQGELPHSNVNGCGVGTCVDTTNGHITSGICTAANKCLGELCDGKPCGGQPQGGTNSGTPTQAPTQTPTQSGITPPSAPSSVYEAAQNGTYNSNLGTATEGPVNWPAPTSNNAIQSIEQLGNQMQGGETTPVPTTIDQAAQQWGGYGQQTIGPVQTLSPEGVPQTSYENVPVNTTNFNSDSTGFNSPSASESKGDIWNQIGDAVRSLGGPARDFIDNVRDAYGTLPKAAEENPNFLEVERAPLMAKLDPSNPAFDQQTYDRVVATLTKEVGSQGPEAMQAALESMVNRMNMRGYSDFNQALNDGFYEVINNGSADAYAKGGISEADYMKADAAIAAVSDGGNICNYCTDQGMPSGIKGPMQIIGGEAFGNMAGDSSWANQQAQLAAQYNATLNPSAYATNIANTNVASLNTGFEGPTINGISGYPSLASAEPSSGFANQNFEFTSAPAPETPANIQALENLPLPEPIPFTPQEDIWNSMLTNAQNSAAQDFNRFYDSVSSIFTPNPNAPIGSNLPTDLSYGGVTNENIFSTNNNAQPFEWAPTESQQPVTRSLNPDSAITNTPSEGTFNQQAIDAFNQDQAQKNFDAFVARASGNSPEPIAVSGEGASTPIGNNPEPIALSGDGGPTTAGGNMPEPIMVSGEGNSTPADTGIPLPEQVQTNPQATIEATNQAEAQAAENKAIEDSLLNDRLAQADQETAKYQADLLAAESKIPVPEMVQVAPQQIASQIVDNNIPLPEQVQTNPQQTIENTNQAAMDQQLNEAQQNAIQNAANPTQSQIEDQVRQANIAEGKYTLSNAGDLRGEFLADPVTAALIPDSMKAKILDAYNNNADSVTFDKSELDSIKWNLANANQATKLENLLGQAGYQRSDGSTNDNSPGIGDIAALQQIAQARQNEFSGQAFDFTSAPAPQETQASLEATADEINKQFVAAQEPSWFKMAQDISNGTLGADTAISQAQQQAINSANEQAQLNDRLAQADQEWNSYMAQQTPKTSVWDGGIGSDAARVPSQAIDQNAQVDAGPSSEPIQNPPLPRERPNLFSYDSSSGIGKSGVDALVNELPATKDLSDAAKAQAADAMRNALIDNPDVAKELLGSNKNVIKNDDVVFPDKGTLNLDALKNPSFQQDLTDNIKSDERMLTRELGGQSNIASFSNSIGQQPSVAAQAPVEPVLVPPTPQTQQAFESGFPEQATPKEESLSDYVQKQLNSLDGSGATPNETQSQTSETQTSGGIGSDSARVPEQSGNLPDETAGTSQKPSETATADTGKTTEAGTGTPCASESCVGAEIGDYRSRPPTEEQQAVLDKINQENSKLNQLEKQYNDTVKQEDKIEAAQSKLGSVSKGLSELNKAISSLGVAGNKSAMTNGVASASQLANDLRALGNKDLANQVDAYVSNMNQLKTSPSLSGANNALSSGQSLLSQATAYLNTKSDSVDSDAIMSQIKTTQSQINTYSNQLQQLYVQQSQVLAPTIPSNWPVGTYTPSTILPPKIPPASTAWTESG